MQTCDEINYLWIGPPTAKNLMAIPGHDIAGPMSLCREFQKEVYKYKNPIRFWCLEEHGDYYRTFFASQSLELDVYSIEGLLHQEAIKEDGSPDEAVQLLLSHLKDLSESNYARMIDLINFKDRFSLFLLIKQPGYFFDTNVFPTPEKMLNIAGQEAFMTAPSFSGSNDYYVMYSPSDNQNLRSLFERRLVTPCHIGTAIFNGLTIPILQLDELGLTKRSYKSYRSSIPGFFRLLKFDAEAFELYCTFTDINTQVSFPCLFSERSIVPYSVCWLNQDLTSEVIKSLPIPTDYAYVSGFRSGEPKTYFYDKKVEPILCNDVLTTFYQDNFLSHYLTNQFVVMQKVSSTFLMQVRSLSKVPNTYPPMLVNTGNCTLLHHAVMTNDIKKVTTLLNMNARLDLKAEYQIKPFESNYRYRYTPLQLAKFLKLDDITILIESRTRTVSDEELMTIEELLDKERLFAELQVAEIRPAALSEMPVLAVAGCANGSNSASLDPTSLLNVQHDCREIDRSGSHEQVAGRRDLNRQLTAGILLLGLGLISLAGLIQFCVKFALLAALNLTVAAPLTLVTVGGGLVVYGLYRCTTQRHLLANSHNLAIQTGAGFI